MFWEIEPHWFWLIIGTALIAGEIIAPGAFLMWLGFAALATGLVSWFLPVGFGIQVIIFGILAVGLVYASRRWMKDNPISSSDPLLNDRSARMVGDLVTVVEAITRGKGRVQVADSIWTASGPDAPAGAQVRVTGVKGNQLTVELL